ncbi:unnamed protein product [Bursaphelenchus xylophilus]|uniref:alpha-1,2-Mannosidase n=1 Tax=Bursaphelenchus xylophilus TaxID=6326 RepID=A0A1I7S7V4_BURXY|nr:unnamed protein product [Bursaphelenchus xylophilus]CAG9087066.1 unnamed protein product [Bursaphelenchus xylophilus]
MGFRLCQKYIMAVVVSTGLCFFFLFIAFGNEPVLSEANFDGNALRVRSLGNRLVSTDGNEFRRILKEFTANTTENDVEYKKNYVKAMMKFAWDNYRNYAWGANELNTAKKSAHSGSVFGAAHIGASIVDSVDTLYMMGLMDEFTDAREWIRQSFDLRKSPSSLSVFETNIRFVGGLLSAYALSNDTMFLMKAREVADLLLPAFDTPTGIPLALVNMNSGRAANWGWASGGCSILSELGSLELEFNYLSKVTGSDLYQKKVKRVREVMDQVEKPDGLYSNYINPKTGRFCLKHVSIGALGDSYYEYLLKVWLQTDRQDSDAKRMYDQAMAALESKLLFTSKPSGLKYFADLRGNRVEHKMDHLACFSAGMYALQSKYETDLEKKMHALEVGKELGKTCHESYIRTTTGIGPEAFRFTPDVEAQAVRDGERYYILRPEVVEGWFFLWRATHDQRYRDWCWAAVQAIDRHCRVEGGFSGVRNVDKVPVVHDDVQQSFILAETLKYLYLVFEDDSVIDLDNWVFNTEAHPFPVMKS